MSTRFCRRARPVASPRAPMLAAIEAASRDPCVPFGAQHQQRKRVIIPDFFFSVTCVHALVESGFSFLQLSLLSWFVRSLK